MVGQKQPGTKISLKVLRNGKSISVPVTLEALGKNPGESGNEGASKAKCDGDWVLATSPLTCAISFRCRTTYTELSLSAFSREVQADNAGLQQGDIILEVNRHKVQNAADVQQALASIPKERMLCCWSGRMAETPFACCTQQKVLNHQSFALPSVVAEGRTEHALSIGGHLIADIQTRCLCGYTRWPAEVNMRKRRIWRPFITLSSVISLLATAISWSAETDKEAAWNLIVSGLKSNSTEERVGAVRVLGLLAGNPKAGELAEHALGDAKPEVRGAAATALGQMHSTTSIPRLKQTLSDKEISVAISQLALFMQ